MDLGSLELGMLLLKWLTANNDKNEVSTPCAAISLTRPESALGPIGLFTVITAWVNFVIRFLYSGLAAIQVLRNIFPLKMQRLPLSEH